jgi:sterol desaturase/sphingolipid hydroxylase (fatty acid hydroxylase superfamily)
VFPRRLDSFPHRRFDETVSIRSFPARLGAGLAAWTLAEYALHRFAMHGHQLDDPLSREHRRHHRDPLATDLRLRLLGHAGVAVASLGVGRLVHLTGVGAGFAAGYSTYEWLHWRSHHRRPTVLERGLRRRHLVHHGRAGVNLGVTTSVWDRAFGTYRAPAPSAA